MRAILTSFKVTCQLDTCREERLRDSVEAPRMDMNGFGDTESSRFFGGDLSARDLNASNDDDDDHQGTSPSGEIVEIDCQQKQDSDTGAQEQDSTIVSTDEKAATAADNGGKDNLAMHKQNSVGFIDPKAEARAKRKAARGSRSSKSVEAPRMFGYDDSESARFYVGDTSSRSLNASPDDLINEQQGEESESDENKEASASSEVQPIKGEKESEELQQESKDCENGLKMHKQKSVSFLDPKAEARAKRKAQRESRLSKSVEAPRMFGYEDSESGRFFADCSSTKNLDVTSSEDFGQKQGGSETELEGDKVAEVKEIEARGQAGENFITAHTNVDNCGVFTNEEEILQPRQTPRVQSIYSQQGEDETKRGMQNEPGNNKWDHDLSDESLGLHLSDVSLGLEDLQKPTVIHSYCRSAKSVHSKESNYALSDVNIVLDDLRPSIKSHQGPSVASCISDISLGLDDLAEETEEDSSPAKRSRSTPDTSKRTSMGSAESIHHSMIPRKTNTRTGDALRRSNSSGPAFGQKRTEGLELLYAEPKKKQAANRMRRTRVARKSDGNLEASMNASHSMMPSAITGLTMGLSDSFAAGKWHNKGPLNQSERSAPAAFISPPTRESRYGKRFSFPLSNSESNGTDDTVERTNARRHRRATVDEGTSYLPINARGERMTRENNEDLGPTRRQSSTASESSSVTRRTSNEGGSKRRLIISCGSDQGLDNSEYSGPLDESDRSRTSGALESIDESDKSRTTGALTNASGILDPHVVEEEQDSFHSTLSHQWGNFIGWTPFRRYRRRNSSSIEMMENQFFIPPPEEGTTFFESLSYAMNGYGNDFVVWIYQASFFTVLTLFFLAYYFLVFGFAAILVAMESHTGGRCGLDVYEAWGKTQSYYELAFELSWTTFTTVGYGVVAPSGDPDDDDNCYGIRFACSLFAFMGLLFNSLSAAIFFSKLERVLTRASVTFSSSACLEFGQAAAFTRGSKGVYGQFWMKNNSMRSLASINTEASKSSRPVCTVGSLGAIQELAGAQSTVPFPFLEFRIVNDHANYKNRAIRNAAVTAMVQLDAKDAESIARGLSKRSNSAAGTFREYVTMASTTHSNSKESLTKNGQRPTSPTSNNENNPTRRAPSNHRQKRGGLTESIIAKAIIVQESDSGEGKGNGPEGRVYYPLNLEPNEHPYFRRVWYIRHTLNAKSPLLKTEVREKIKADGSWDPTRSSYQDVLSSLVDFHRIRITFKGTSAASNSLVFAQKVYTIEDVYVGWQFGQIFYEKERWMWFRKLWRGAKMRDEHEEEDGADDSNLMLDKRLIHDILPQPGGGQEPIEG